MREKSYRPWNLDQQLLFPPSLHDWLPEDHLVFQIYDVVQQLDLSEICSDIQGKDRRGTRPYHPRMMLMLLIYAYSSGIYSSRKIEKATYEQIPFRVLTANQHPHYTVINDFRSRHLKALPGLFAQVVLMCRQLGFVKLGHLSLDGTKVKANASKHKAMSYKRMKKEISKLEAEIRELLSRAENADAEEDEEYGADSDGQDIPEELRRRESRLERIKQAKEALEMEGRKAKARDLRERAAKLRKAADGEENPTERKRKLTRAANNDRKAEKLEAENDSADDDSNTDGNSPDLPGHRVPTTPDGVPKDEAQRNFTDPESRIMKRNQEYLQGYNAQAVVDEEHQVIVGQAVTNQPPDQQHLKPMIEITERILGEKTGVFTADAGYISADNVRFCESAGIDAYISTKRCKHGERIEPDDTPPPDDLEAVERMAAKTRTSLGLEVYARRKVITEPVFGQIKGARAFPGFSLRGIEKVRGEWTLVCLCHNILKLISARASGSSPLLPDSSLLGPLYTAFRRLNDLLVQFSAFCAFFPGRILRNPLFPG